MFKLHKQDTDRYNTSLRNVSPRFTARDGRKVKLRLMRPADLLLMIEFFHRMSPETRRRRFHTGTENVSDEFILQNAEELATVDNTVLMGAVVAVYEEEDGPHMVGSVRLARDPNCPNSPEAEAAVVVRDDFQGQGLGTELMRRLVLLAKKMQVKTILAVFQADNEDAIRLFRELNLPHTTTIDHGATMMRLQVPAE